VRELVGIFRALGDPTRLRILKLLSGGELCVCQLVAALQLSQPSISQHLAALRRAGLVEDRKVKRWVYYRLREHRDPTYVEPLLQFIAGCLNCDEQVVADAERMRRLRAIDVAELCGKDPSEFLAQITAVGSGNNSA